MANLLKLVIHHPLKPDYYHVSVNINDLNRVVHSAIDSYLEARADELNDSAIQFLDSDEDDLDDDLDEDDDESEADDDSDLDADDTE